MHDEGYATIYLVIGYEEPLILADY